MQNAVNSNSQKDSIFIYIVLFNVCSIYWPALNKIILDFLSNIEKSRLFNISVAVTLLWMC